MEKFIESLRTITDSHQVALEKLRHAQEELRLVEEPLNALRQESHQLTLELKREQIHEAEAFLLKDSLASRIHKLRSGIQELEAESNELDVKCLQSQNRSRDLAYGLKLDQFREELKSFKQYMQANSAAYLELQRLEEGNRQLSSEANEIMQQLVSHQSSSTAQALDKEKDALTASLAFAQTEYKFTRDKLMELQANLSVLTSRRDELQLATIAKDAELQDVANRRANATARTAQLEERIVQMRSGSNHRSE